MTVVDHVRGAELAGMTKAGFCLVDGNDHAGGEEFRSHDRREPDRAHAHDGDRVAGLNAAAQHTDFERGRQDVGQEQDLLIGQRVRRPVDRGVREWDSRTRLAVR